jgi:hypothetical protein
VSFDEVLLPFDEFFDSLQKRREKTRQVTAGI